MDKDPEKRYWWPDKVISDAESDMFCKGIATGDTFKGVEKDAEVLSKNKEG